MYFAPAVVFHPSSFRLHPSRVEDGDTVMKAEDIGATVREVREKLGMTQRALARKIGGSQAQVTRVENGLQGVRSSTLVKVAGALSVPPFRLLMTGEEWARWKRGR